jgi:hypothetical protein
MPQAETITVRAPLTEADRAELSMKMADIVTDLEDMEQEKKDAAKSFKAKMDLMTDVLRDHRNVVHQGWQEKQVACRVVFDGRSQTAFFYSITDGELQKSRPMTPVELQQDLPLEMPESKPAAYPFLKFWRTITLRDHNTAKIFLGELRQTMGHVFPTELF